MRELAIPLSAFAGVRKKRGGANAEEELPFFPWKKKLINCPVETQKLVFLPKHRGRKRTLVSSTPRSSSFLCDDNGLRLSKNAAR